MKKVAIPVCNGKLSEYPESCNHYEVFSIADGRVKSQEIETVPERNPDHLPEWAFNKGITDIIFFKAHKKLIYLFAPYRINLFIGIPINTPQKLIEAYIKGNLKSDENIISAIDHSP